MLKRFMVHMGGCFLIWLLSSSCGSHNQEVSATIKADPAGSQEERIITREEMLHSDVKFTPLMKRVVKQEIEASGFVRVLPRNHVVITTLVPGHVKKVFVREGEWVKAGAPLFLIEDPGIIELQQSYLEAYSGVAALQANFVRQKKLAEENISSEKALMSAESDYLAVLAKVTGLRCKLKMLGMSLDRIESAHFTSTVAIKSPIEGSVSSLGVTAGMFLSPEREGVEVINPKGVYLALSVFENEVAGLKIGGPVRFRVPDRGDGWQKGTVLFVGQQVRDESRTVSVQVKVDESASHVLPGMFVEARCLLSGDTVRTLAADAVFDVEGRQWALMKINEDDHGVTVKRVAVSAQLADEGYFTVLNADTFPEGSSFMNRGVDF